MRPGVREVAVAAQTGGGANSSPARGSARARLRGRGRARGQGQGEGQRLVAGREVGGGWSHWRSCVSIKLGRAPLAQIKSYRYTKAHLAISFVHSRTDPGWCKGADRTTHAASRQRPQRRSCLVGPPPPPPPPLPPAPGPAISIVCCSPAAAFGREINRNPLSPIPNPQSPISKIQHHPHSAFGKKATTGN